jgi:chromosome segregation ATPase
MLKELNTLKKQNKDLATLIVNYNDKVAELEKKIVQLESKSDLDFVDWKDVSQSNSELEKEVKHLRYLKTENVSLHTQIIGLKKIISDSGDEIKRLNEQEVKQPEFKISDKLKQLFTTNHRIADAKSTYISWEEAAANLALRVVKLEQDLKYSPKIKFTPTDNNNNAPY